MRNRTLDLRMPRFDARDHGERGLLRSSYDTRPARIGNVDSVIFVNTIREMVSFELGKEIDKDVFRLVMSVAQRKNYESP